MFGAHPFEPNKQTTPNELSARHYEACINMLACQQHMPAVCLADWLFRIGFESEFMLLLNSFFDGVHFVIEEETIILDLYIGK